MRACVRKCEESTKWTPTGAGISLIFCLGDIAFLLEKCILLLIAFYGFPKSVLAKEICIGILNQMLMKRAQFEKKLLCPALFTRVCACACVRVACVCTCARVRR